MGSEGGSAFAQMALQHQQAQAEFKASLDEARAIDEQTRIIKEEGKIAASISEDENRKFLAKQKMAYIVNGVDLVGSPLLVLEETEAIGKEEVKALKKSTAARARLSLGKSKRVLSRGRAAFFEAAAKNIVTSSKLSKSKSKSKSKRKTRGV